MQIPAISKKEYADICTTQGVQLGTEFARNNYAVALSNEQALEKLWKVFQLVKNSSFLGSHLLVRVLLVGMR